MNLIQTSAANVRPFSPRRTSRPRRQIESGGALPVAESTGPLEWLGDCQSVLVIADIENLAYSARDLQVCIDFAALAGLFRKGHQAARLHAYFSAHINDDKAAAALAAMGWDPHTRSIIEQGPGKRCSANADLAFAFGAAVELGRQSVDACVLATGDGVLALDTARAIRACFPSCKLITTMSLAGATSRLLDARTVPEIDVNIEIGRDVMIALPHISRRIAHARASA